jgi:hypothetical protein
MSLYTHKVMTLLLTEPCDALALTNQLAKLYPLVRIVWEEVGFSLIDGRQD